MSDIEIALSAGLALLAIMTMGAVFNIRAWMAKTDERLNRFEKFEKMKSDSN